jgi:uncharacterized protein (TIGR03435 family)
MEEKAPQWVTQQGFDLEATAGRPVAESECRLMTQSLLADRFKLSIHRGAKEGQSYHLVIARGGSKLEKIKDTDQGRGVYITVNGLLSQYLPGAEPDRGLTMEQLARKLGQMTNRVPVQDRTGLAGLYKITLKFSTRLSAEGDSDPALGPALERQLGLRLEEHKGPVETFVLDNISQPSAN